MLKYYFSTKLHYLLKSFKHLLIASIIISSIVLFVSAAIVFRAVCISFGILSRYVFMVVSIINIIRGVKLFRKIYWRVRSRRQFRGGAGYGRGYLRISEISIPVW